MYRLLIHREALKFLDRLSLPQRKSLAKTVDGLPKNPFPKGKKLKKLHGPQDGWRLRVGNLRILYTVDPKKKEVFIYKIAHRSEVYR